MNDRDDVVVDSGDARDGFLEAAARAAVETPAKVALLLAAGRRIGAEPIGSNPG